MTSALSGTGGNQENDGKKYFRVNPESAYLSFYKHIQYFYISIGNSMIYSDIWHKYHE